MTDAEDRAEAWLKDLVDTFSPYLQRKVQEQNQEAHEKEN